MAEYIERQSVYDVLRKAPISNMGTKLYIYDDIADIPAANVVERKTGKWEEYGEPNAYGKFEIWYHKCNLCGAIGIREFSYCPNCGARMASE